MHGGLVAHVDAQVYGALTEGLDGGDGLRAFLIQQVEHRDVATLAGDAQGAGLTDAAGAASDQGDATFDRRGETQRAHAAASSSASSRGMSSSAAMPWKKALTSGRSSVCAPSTMIG